MEVDIANMLQKSQLPYVCSTGVPFEMLNNHVISYKNGIEAGPPLYNRLCQPSPDT